MARKVGEAIPARTMARVAELVGLGLSHSESARAAQVGERTVARILQRPEYKKMADDVRRQRGSASTQVRAIIGDLLRAENHDGTPDMAARGKGVEYATKLGLEELDEMDVLDGDEAVLPGVVLRFPYSAPLDSRVSAGAAGAEAPSPPRASPENGTTLPPPPDLDLDPAPFMDTDLTAEEQLAENATVEAELAEQPSPEPELFSDDDLAL